MSTAVKTKKLENQLLVFPTDQIFNYLRSGKFEALSSEWRHESMPLTIDHELIVVTDGTLYIRYMDEEFTVKPGEYVILPPSDSKREGFKSSYCSFYWLHFTAKMGRFPYRIHTGEKESYERAACFMLPQSGQVPRSEKMIIQMKQLQDLTRSNYPAITLNALTTAILTELYGQLTAESFSNENSVSNKQIYSDIVDYIKRNIQKSLKVSEIADEFGYSPKYLSHLFTDIRGMSLKQFVLMHKMYTACFFLTDSDMNISEVAGKVGFSDVHNFSRTFKKTMGLSPSIYRDTYAKRMLYHV